VAHVGLPFPGAARCSPWWERHWIRAYRRGDWVWLQRSGWKGWPLESLKLFLGCDHPRAVLETVEVGVSHMLERKAYVKGSGPTGRATSDPRFSKEYPVLWDHLTQTAWKGGDPRETSSLTIFFNDGWLKCVLKERNEPACLWVCELSFFGLLAALEAALTSDRADWRNDRQDGPNGKGGRIKKS
jgi:hypothetical protein